MSIRLIARELYQLRQKVEKIEKERESAPFDQRVEMDRQLQEARADLRQMQKILDGRIDR